MGFSKDRMVGSCVYYVDGENKGRRACYLDFIKGQFVLGRCNGDTPWGEAIEGRNIEFKDVVFENVVFERVAGENRCGTLRAEKLTPSFLIGSRDVSSDPSEFFQRDTFIGELEASDSYIINGEIEFDASESGSAVLLVPGVAFPVKTINLDDELEVSCVAVDCSVVRGKGNLSPDEVFALSLAVGGPLRKFASHDGNKVRVVLCHRKEVANYRPLFFCVRDDGWRDSEKIRECVPKIFQAALKFDERNDLRILASAFLEAWSANIGLNLKALAASQVLDGLVKSNGNGAQADVCRLMDLGMSEDEANFIRDFRNWVIHGNIDLLGFLKNGNPNKPAGKRTKEVDHFCSYFPIYAEHAGSGALNFLMSFTVNALLKKMGACVETSLHWPMKGEFSFDKLTTQGKQRPLCSPRS